MSVTHPTVAAGPNDPTKQVSSDAWNEEHEGEITDSTAGTVRHGSRGSGLHADSHAETHDSSTHLDAYDPAGTAATEVSDHIAAIGDHGFSSISGTISDGQHGSRGSGLHVDAHSNANDPSAGQKAALAGTNGTPGAGNLYVTDSDPRNSDARTPITHSMASHTDEGALATKNTVASGDIDDNAVTLAKLADLATARILGRVTGGSGDPEALTGTQATTLLDIFTDLLKGLVPASGGGTANFLRADGVFAAPPGGAGTDPPEGSYAPGSFTIATGKFRIMVGQLELTGTQTCTIEGTGGLYIA